MPLHGTDRLTGLILSLSGLIPASCLATPDLARATATVSARALAPVSVGVTYAATIRQTHSGHQYPLHIGSKLPKSRQMAQKQPLITLFFN